MSKIEYIDKQISGARLCVIEQVNEIIGDYESQGYSLTLRQLYYQFVGKALIENSLQSYKRLGSIINDGRLCGLIDWDAIVDMTRNIQKNNHWNSPSEIVEACAKQYQIDKWATQDFRVEVWIEKDALVNIASRPCRMLDVPLFSCRGYTSQSEMWRAGKRLSEYIKAGQIPIIIHLGDHDPSGIDMTRDIKERLELFTDASIEVERIALNMAQVKKYNPPPNPAKITDTRAGGYIRRYGLKSWELDALEPKVLNDLITDAIFSYRDVDRWAKMQKKEDAHKAKLDKVVRRLSDGDKK